MTLQGLGLNGLGGPGSGGGTIPISPDAGGGVAPLPGLLQLQYLKASGASDSLTGIRSDGASLNIFGKAA